MAQTLPGTQWDSTGSLDMLQYEVMRKPMSSQGAALIWVFLDLSRHWAVSRWGIRRRINHWLVNQHWVQWRVLRVTQRQAQGLVSGPCLGAKARFLSFNPYPTAFPYGNGMVLHFYQQQENSTTKTVHKVINKGLKTYV